jgi:hypothetical protein
VAEAHAVAAPELDFVVSEIRLLCRATDQFSEPNSGHEEADPDRDEPPADRQRGVARRPVETEKRRAERRREVTRQRELPELVVRDRQPVGRDEDAREQSGQ